MTPGEARAREAREWLAKAGVGAALLEQADVHSDYAWKLRYPGALYTPEPDEAAVMFGIAGDIFREIQSRLPLQTRAS